MSQQTVCSFLLLTLLLNEGVDAQTTAVSTSSSTIALNISVCSIIGGGTNSYQNAAMMLAVNRLYNAGILPQSIKFTFYTGYGCPDNVGVGASYACYVQNKPDVMLPAGCSNSSEPIGMFAATLWDLTLVQYISTSIDFENKTIYQTLSRTSFSQGKVAVATLDLLEYFNWTEFAVVYWANPSTALFTTPFFSLLPNWSNLTMLDSFIINNPATDPYVIMPQMRATARVFVLSYVYTPMDARPLMLQLYSQNMTGGDYVYIIPFALKGSVSQLPYWAVWPDDGYNAIAQEAYKNVIVIDVEGINWPTISPFNTQVWQMLQQPPFNLPASTTNTNSTGYAFASDAIYLYGLALNSSLQVNSTAYKSGHLMLNWMKNRQFIGASGTVQMAPNGERVGIFDILQVDSTGNATAILRMIVPSVFVYGPSSSTIIPLRPVWWPYGYAPQMIPVCGFLDNECIASSTVNTIIGVVLGIFLLLAVIGIGIFKQRQIAFERDLVSMVWKLDPMDVHIISTKRATGSFLDRLGSQASLGMSKLSLGAEGGGAASRAPGVGAKSGGTFAGCALYRGETVVVKKVRKQKVEINFQRSDLLQLKALRDARHENLNTFLGIAMDKNPQVLVVWSYCIRGSLEDVLFNDDIKLEITFRVSMLKDLVKGLEYLHKSPQLRCHGSLAATNCVLDSRWMLKLTDFGLYGILNIISDGTKKHTENSDSNHDDELPNTQYLLHFSPESLRCYLEGQPLLRNRDGDIYALGMITHQILTREQLFTETHLLANEILHQIAYPPSLSKLMRPSLEEKGDLDEGFGAFVAECWKEEPSSRPHISAVRNSLYKLTKSYKSNVVEHIVTMMEKYAEGLEKTVEDRTKAVTLEREKADSLLREMLPRMVVDDLKAGKVVPPQTFESATIYFSDIVSFTVIASDSTPFQVVTMLNTLYSHFDEILKKNDCYKVETIGDAYMVVSGVPMRNGMRHVNEIADVALKIRNFVENDFKIPHKPTQSLRVRIGVHTGPVAAVPHPPLPLAWTSFMSVETTNHNWDERMEAAHVVSSGLWKVSANRLGVVGVRMPRYCLFGDTVNIAAQMESTGQAMKIQLSSDAANMLSVFPVYVLEKRGVVELHGKEGVETFWLLEKQKSVCSMGEAVGVLKQQRLGQHTSPVVVVEHPAYIEN